MSKFTFNKLALDTIVTVLPPQIVTSEQIEADLSAMYKRLRLPTGRLELMTGIQQRRFWPPKTKPSACAALAGEKALLESGIDSKQIDLLVHCAVCRDFMEPATASIIHNLLSLRPSCAISDLSNACLGMLSAVYMAGGMIEAGLIRTALLVTGETAEPLHQATIKKLRNDLGVNRAEVKRQFASLTIGSGAAAIILRHVDDCKNNGHRILGGATLTDSDASKLCQENVKDNPSPHDGPLMATDSENLLIAGCQLAAATWTQCKNQLQWANSTPDLIVTHQVGTAHRNLLYSTLELDVRKDFATVSYMGNTGSAALPTALALAASEKKLQSGQKVALLGIGSGLSALMLGVEW